MNTRIPRETLLETAPPAVFASRLALREGNRKKPIYEIHKWWARRLGSVFRNLLISAATPSNQSSNGRFYKKQDLRELVVLDPFVGGGTTLVEAAKCNANVIGVDIDPVACFVTQKELEPIGEPALEEAFRYVESRAKERILKWYRTTLSDGSRGTVIHVFWVEIIKCPDCGIEAAGHPHYQLSRDPGRKRQAVFCARCGEVATIPLLRKQFTCSQCGEKTNIEQGPVEYGRYTCRCGEIHRISDLAANGRPLPKEIFALEVLRENGEERVFKKADPWDIALYTRARKILRRLRKIKAFLPPDEIPVKYRSDLRPISFGYRRYQELFNERQKLCLLTLASTIASVPNARAREFLAAAFSDALAANNMLCFYAFDYRKLTPLFGLHAYHRVSRPVENNVWGTEVGRGSFLKCYRKLIRAKSYARTAFEYRYARDTERPQRVFTGERIAPRVRKKIPTSRINGNYAVLLNQSSERLHTISSASIDLTLTDPPYYNNLAYSELADFFHVWLRRLGLRGYPAGRKRSTMARSLFVRREVMYAEQDHERFTAGLVRVFRECHRVVKPAGLMVFTFHHAEKEAWTALGRALYRSHFSITKVFPVRSEGQSQFHSDEGNLKWDAVFCCRRRIGYSGKKRPRGCLAIARIEGRAALAVARWRARLRRAGFDLGKSDEQSLKWAFVVEQACNSGVDPKVLLTRETERVAAGRDGREGNGEEEIKE